MHKITYMAFRIFWSAVFIIMASSINGQSVSDAVRYSLLNYSSSARATGAGNAFSSLGAELSTASTNPAGIAEFRKSEFVLSLDFLKRNTTASLRGGNTSNDERTLNNLTQIAAVFVKRDVSPTWKTFNLAIGMNTTNLFHQNFQYNGTTPGSIVERFVEIADGLAPNQLDNFEAGLAYDVQLLYDFEDDDFYESDFTDFSANVQKSQTVQRTGSQKEVFITFGGNMNNKLSVGATLGIPIIRFEETKIYNETDPTDEVPFFNSLEFVEYLQTTGVGINGKIGAIYKVNNNLRVGASFHSPSALFLRDVFTTDLIHNFETNQVERLEGLSPESNFQYLLTTPFRAIGGASYIYRAGKLRGFVSAEAEYIGYTGNRFNLTINSDASGDIDFQNELNDDVKSELTSALNVRLGAELGYGPARVRAGYEQIGNPYSAQNGDISPKLSIGLGLRGNTNYIDIAYQIQDVDVAYAPYLLSNIGSEQNVSNSISNTNLIVTAGFKF